MNRMFAITTAVVADAIRRKVVWIVLLFAGLLAIAIPSLPSYGVGVAAAVYREVSIALMFVAALAVSLSLATVRIPSEVERRTVYTVLARDVARWQYLVATWAGIFAVTGIVVLVYTVIAVAIGFFTYGAPMFVLFQASLAVWLEAGVIAALAVMLSTRFGVVTNILGALAFLFVGHSLTSLFTQEGAAAAPWYIPSLDLFNVIDPVAHGSGYGVLYAISMLGGFAAWCAVLQLSASAIFAQRDL